MFKEGESNVVLPSAPSETANDVSSSPAREAIDPPKSEGRGGASASESNVTFERAGVEEKPSFVRGEPVDFGRVLRSMTSFLTLGLETKAFALGGTSSVRPLPRRRGDPRAWEEREEGPILDEKESGEAFAAGEETDEVPNPRNRVIFVDERLTGVPRKAVKMGGFFFSSTGRAGELPTLAKRGFEP